MVEDEVRAEIARLECEIEALAGELASCRKIMVVARLAMAAAAAWIAALLTGLASFQPLGLIAAISALLAGQMRQERNGEPRLVQLVQSTRAFDLPEVCEIVDQQQQEMANGNRIEFPLTRRFDKLLGHEASPAEAGSQTR